MVVEYHALAIEHDAHRRQYVVEQRLGGQWPPQLAADRIDRPGCSERRPDAAFVAAQALLILPINPYALGDTGVSSGGVAFAVEYKFSRSGANGWIVEVGAQPRQAIRREPLPRVGEHDDLASRSGDAGVERQRFAAARQFNQPYALAKRGHRVCGPIGRSVRDDN